MAATIVNSVAGISPGFGIPTTNQTKGLTAISGASLVSTSLTLTTAVSRGYLLIKLVNGGSSDTAAVMSATLSDGTATVTILAAQTARVIANQANSGLALVVPFLVDIAAVTLAVEVTLTGTTKTADLDFGLAGNP